MENKKETKDLLVDQNNKEKSTSLSNDTGNSFYEGGTKKSKTKWTQDWRGKTLFVSIAALILIGMAIPSGMAIANYFNHNDKDINFGSVEISGKISNEISATKNAAIVDRFDLLNEEGYISNDTYDTITKNAIDEADETISNKKSELKNNFGNTWESEWFSFLSDEGFSDEDEYKDSLISDKYITNITPFYTNNSNIITTVDDDSGFRYVSDAKDESASEKKYKAIVNSTPNGNSDEILTPENLMTAYLNIFQPVSLNTSPINFTPIGGKDTASGEADINGAAIKIEQDNLRDMFALAFQLEDPTTFEPKETTSLGVKSLSKFDLASPEANLAAYSFISGSSMLASTTPSALRQILVDSLTGYTGAPSDINDAYIEYENGNITSDNLDEIGEVLLGKLRAIKLMNDTASTADRKYGLSLEINSNNYFGYLSTSGITIVGFNSQNGATDLTTYQENLVQDALNYSNGLKVDPTDGYEIIDPGLISSFTSWVSTNIEDIILLPYISDVDNLDELGNKVKDILNESEFNGRTDWTTQDGIDAAKINYFGEYIMDGETFAKNKFTEVSTYVKTNNKLFDTSTWISEESSFITTIKDLNVVYKYSLDQFSSLNSSKSKAILNKGDDN